MPTYAYGHKLKDAAGNIILPVTRSQFVFMEDGATLEDVLSPYMPHAVHDKSLNDKFPYGSICGFVFDLSNYQWSRQYEYGCSFYHETTSVAIVIKLEKTSEYNIKKTGLQLSLRNGSGVSVSVSKKTFSSWPPESPTELLSTGINYGNEYPNYYFDKTFDTDIDNGSENGNACIVIEITGSHMQGYANASLIGDLMVNDPVVTNSNFYVQKSTSDLMDNKSNPFKGMTLQSILLQLNDELESLKK